MRLKFTGGTGVGKSSTINALFGREISRVGIHAEPETMEIKSYELNDKITLWDSPGLGDGKKDPEHARKIVDLLRRKDSSGAYMIDLVLVLADAASRDLGTTYSLISDVIVPNLGDANDKKTRIIAALNKCDAVNPRHWDYTNSRPDAKLTAELDGRADTFRRRVKETTGVDVDTMYYSAGYKDDDNAEQEKPYNLAKLLSLIVSHTPDKKRLVVLDNVSRDQEAWRSNDSKRDYRKDIRDSVSSGMKAVAGAAAGAEIGSMFGPIGTIIGAGIGGFLGWLLG
ncbi:MAG: 50S ribosome-binding GTPase [Synergistaceae bacterium]|nr:50S ribosome-binding GTPase [Synergistaceae bacterium]